MKFAWFGPINTRPPSKRPSLLSLAQNKALVAETEIIMFYRVKIIKRKYRHMPRGLKHGLAAAHLLEL